jgi:hypothetical protein
MDSRQTASLAALPSLVALGLTHVPAHVARPDFRRWGSAIADAPRTAHVQQRFARPAQQLGALSAQLESTNAAAVGLDCTARLLSAERTSLAEALAEQQRARDSSPVASLSPPKTKKKQEVKVGTQPGKDAAAHEPDDAVADGHFLAAWPWPVRMLREPLTLEEFDLAHDVVDRLPFARLEGEDDHAQPFCRSYEVILLRDGRWLLAFVDPGVSDVVIAGWFD